MPHDPASEKLGEVAWWRHFFKCTSELGKHPSATICMHYGNTVESISIFILLHQKFLQFDWLRAVVFRLNLKYLHVKITNLLWVVV